MSLEERLDVPAAQSRASRSATFRPREAASSAEPVPVDPPPITTTSNTSPANRRRAAARWRGPRRDGSSTWLEGDDGKGMPSARLPGARLGRGRVFMADMVRGQRRWRWQQGTWGELGAEFLGTFVLIAFGCGVVAMVVAALNQSGRGAASFASEADWLLIAWGWGFAVAFGVYVAGGISGAHINPAVTLAFALRRGFEWRKVPAYWAAQLFGAFVGGFLVYLNYKAAIGSLDAAKHVTRGSPDSVATFSIFATFPAPYFKSPIGPLADQVIGTAFLVGFVFAVTDEYNAPVKSNLAPIVIGFVVVAIGLSYGANAGYAINPARDLGPRLVTWIEGWKKIAMPGDYGNVNTYFWVPLVGPLIGAAIGAFIYDGLIRKTLLARGASPDPEVVEQGEDVIDRPGGSHAGDKPPEVR